MNIQWKKNPYVGIGVTAFVVVAALMVFYRLIANLSGIGAALSTVADMLLPFIIGLALAYLLSPFYDWVRQLTQPLLAGKKATPRRFAAGGAKVIATVASLLLVFVIVGGLLSMVIPQAYQSISNLIVTLPDKSNAVLSWVNETADKFGKGDALAAWLSDGITWATSTAMSWVQNDLLPNLGNIAKNVSSGLIGVVGTVTDVFVGIIICVYTLNSKELFAAQAKKLIYSLFKIPTANYIVGMTRYVDRTFGKFINGILIDSALLGVLCFIGMSILRMPYALLISVIVGLFNVVPIFGPLVSGVVGTFFVLLENPVKALIFLVFILVLGQLDGNVIAPKILGDQTGLSGFWVIFAIVVGGGLFGLWGMILGVPTFAIVYSLIAQGVKSRLQKKNLPDDTEAFNELVDIDENTGEPHYPASSVVETAAVEDSKE